MAEFFQRMNEDYKQKNFPDGSLFGKMDKIVRRNGIIAIIIFFGPMFLASSYGLIVIIRRSIEKGVEKDDIGFTVGVCAVLAVLALLFLAMIIYFLKLGSKKSEYYVGLSAKHSKLSESDIRNFQQQAFASDCYILKLTDGLDRVLSNNFIKDGFLTRDYIYLSDPRQTVIRIEDLKACCFENYTYYLNNKKINNLGIRLIASNGVTSFSDTTYEAGNALMELLVERNSGIDTNNGEVLREGAEASRYVKRMLGK